MNQEMVSHLLLDIKKNEPSKFANIMRAVNDSDDNTLYKMRVNPKLITEVGDNYAHTVSTIYKLISESQFYATIVDNDIIETRAMEAGVRGLPQYIELINNLYSLYPELQKEPMMFVSFNNWTPVVTQIKGSISIDCSKIKVEDKEETGNA